MDEAVGEPLRLRLDDDYQDSISFHRWFAMRGASTARAAVAFTTSPEWLSDPAKLTLVASGDDAAIASAIAHGGPERKPENQEERLLDLCAGVGTVGAAAARLGFQALSVELSIVPHLIDRVLHDFAVSLAKGSNSVTGADGERLSSWRGFATEVEDFANAVWRGTKARLKDLFEEDVDIRLWVRIVPCPFCGSQVPVLSNVRLSRDTALDISPAPGFSGSGEFPRFGLLRTEFPDRKGTFARGICTCPVCHRQFPFRGYDLIPLRAVPVAVRMRNSSALTEMDVPEAYVMKVEAASYNSLTASSRTLGNRIILADQKSIFHDARGEPISVHHALLPRQRAYFTALAESMTRESALLAERASLTSDHRFAIRSAVALLISGQIDYVNTFAHWLVDKPHPSASAGPLRVAGLFTEVGGYWLERFWQNRLHHLLNLLRENSSSPRPVRAIHADAANIPLDDSSVSAVVWDPPRSDDVDYDSVGEPYQAILAAMVPDLVSELIVPPRLPLPERTERYKRDLEQQAREARRVIKPEGAIGMFWLDREPAELQRFLEMIAQAGLQLRGAVRLDRVRTRVVAGTGPGTYLLVLQPIPAAVSAVVADGEKVLALAAAGALSLYDALAELLESVWDPAVLDGMIPGEFLGSSRHRLAGFLASHPEPEQLLVELGRTTLIRELVNRGAYGDELRVMDARGLAQQLLAKLGFAVARPARFSIRAELRECAKVESRLELADSLEAIRGAFDTGCSLIERILRYASLAWSRLVCGNQWNEALARIIIDGTSQHSYPGPDRLNFGDHKLLFTQLPATFAKSDNEFERALFSEISWRMKKAKIHDKTTALVKLRNDVGHTGEAIVSLSLPQFRQRCHAVLAEARTALENLDSQQLLPLTVRPDEERRDRYGRRILRMLDADGVAIEAYVVGETDLTEPLIYFASDSSRRDVDPRFLPAATVEEIFGPT